MKHENDTHPASRRGIVSALKTTIHAAGIVALGYVGALQVENAFSVLESPPRSSAPPAKPESSTRAERDCSGVEIGGSAQRHSTDHTK